MFEYISIFTFKTNISVKVNEKLSGASKPAVFTLKQEL